MSALLLFLAAAGCSSLVYHSNYFADLYGPSPPKCRLMTAEEIRGDNSSRKIIYFVQDVRPILDSRDVVCHSCYDIPCQLKLGSIEGIDRGGTKQLVYDFVRFKTADSTRLCIDANEKEQFLADYGMRRTNSAFWHYSDWFNRQNKKLKGMEGGLLDLNR